MENKMHWKGLKCGVALVHAKYRKRLKMIEIRHNPKHHGIKDLKIGENWRKFSLYPKHSILCCLPSHTIVPPSQNLHVIVTLKKSLNALSITNLTHLALVSKFLVKIH